MTKKSYAIEDISIGMMASYTRTINDSDVRQFAEISGDNNPVHLDDEYAEKSRYKRRIAHGLFSVSFFSAIFGTQLPGEGCVYAGQNIKFKWPVYIGDTVLAEVKVLKVDAERKVVTFETTCKVGVRKVITGTAEIFIP